jgi:N-acyl-D-aspartate/D-glutamate deacylase/dipeptidyl aminopeptidase/acylaminoacyl peptidase
LLRKKRQEFKLQLVFCIGKLKLELLTPVIRRSGCLMKIRYTLTLSIVLSLSISLFAQTNSPTIAQILSMPFASDLTAAPTGERIAWLLNVEGKRNVWIAEGPNFKARQLTAYNNDDGQELTNLSFTSDGKWLVFVRGGDSNQSGETPNPTNNVSGAEQAIYAAAWDDGRVIKLADGSDPVVSPVSNNVIFSNRGLLWLNTINPNDKDLAKKAQPLFLAKGSNYSPQWSPDGKRLAFISARGDHNFIGVLDPASDAIKYLAPSIDRDSSPRWSPDGKRIAFVRQPTRGTKRPSMMEETPDPWAIWVADVESGKAREVWRSGNNLDDAPPRMAGEKLLQWAADDRLVFQSEQAGWQHLYSLSASLTGGGGEAKLLTPGNYEIEDMTLAPDKKSVVFSANKHNLDGRDLFRVAIAGGNVEAITTNDKLEWNPVVLSNGKLAYLASDVRKSGTPHVHANLNATAQSLVVGAETMPKEFPAAQLVTPQAVTFNAADGIEVHAQLFLPPNARASDKLPAVIFSHGGPTRQMWLGWHSMYYYHQTYGGNQLLASKGYAVLSVNFRGGIGYGRAFREAPKRGMRGASEYQDIVAAAQYLRGRNDVDANRIGLWGGSYGGFLTALGLARNSDLFAAGVDVHGVHDWTQRLSAAGEGGNREAMKIALDSSPIGSAEKWRAPVLFIHGDDDRSVTFSQTTELARRLRELNKPFEQMVIPGEGHDFLLHRTWVDVFSAAADFLDRNLKTKQGVSQVDVLIRGGRVIDGSGGQPINADVGITGDRIVFVGDGKSLKAARTIDATGLIVAPGFIDPHTHANADLTHEQRKSNVNFLMQGVTTVVTNNDGGGALPLSKTLTQMQTQGIGTNAVLLVGQGSVRQAVLGMSDAAPNDEQLAQMKTLVQQAMDDGAFGLSTGLYYAPGSYAKTEEVIELAKVVAANDGVYDSHIRDESSYTIGLLASIDEVIRIGREAHLPVHISHIKALGVDVWGKSNDVIAMINRARADGINITANQYPYTASGTSVTASLVPRWAEVGGNTELLKRLDDPAVRPKLVAEMETNLKRRGGANSLLLTFARNREFVGKRLDEIAKSMNKTPVEAALEVIKQGGSSVASFNMQEADIENFMKQDWVMTGSDGSAGHPRKYGTYPRKLSEYVFKRRVITLPRMIQASSAQVADTFRIPERGRIAVNQFADVIVFDEKTVAERATYEQPEVLSVGMKYVIVNGKLAVEDGKYTGALAGRPLRKINQ